MKKKTITTLIITFSILIIIGIWVFSSTYNNARDQYTGDHEQSKTLALEQGKLSAVGTVETYYGQEKYHVMTGKNSKGDKVYAWVLQSEKNQKVIIKKQSSGISKNQAITAVQEEYNPAKIIDVKLGMDEGIPIWEVKYLDESKRYTFDLVNFYDGEIVKHMAIKNTGKS
ncbi:hypothetical protein WQ54_30075 [Bacillus sp. SA1-12]|uniref:cell wall elongation regulator TseB-like domain-containing protein n=1 Tax=Bacillus sp. SA1-12 TaxID=1455638 RepID=UPI000626ED62|nr:DUF5590 domain-containing protein [Bacillus sp. SA1-12]KKI88757.1 hypothetical protein WQ54_30075 [Bacillus sp. SA1-12]